MDLSTILGWLSGNTGGPSTPVYPPGVSLNRPQGGGYPNGLAIPGAAPAGVPVPVSPKVDLPPVPGATQQIPPVPGNQRIPMPTARPPDLLGMLMGPSAPPSQEGAMYSPSQGPGDAVTQATPDTQTPVSAAMRAPPGAGAGAASAPRAPAPPGPNRMSPGMLNALIGGQNPLAAGAQTPPVMALLSKLLGGR